MPTGFVIWINGWWKRVPLNFCLSPSIGSFWSYPWYYVPEEFCRNHLEENLQNACANFPEGKEKLLPWILALVWGLLEDQNILGSGPGQQSEGILSTSTVFLLTSVQQKQAPEKESGCKQTIMLSSLSPIKDWEECLIELLLFLLAVTMKRLKCFGSQLTMKYCQNVTSRRPVKC